MKKGLLLFLLIGFMAGADLSAQWALQKTNGGDNFNTLWVDMVDANTVWASLEQNVGGYYFNPINKVVRTLDGGKNWTTFDVGTDPLDYITCIHARSAQELWLTTFNYGTFSGKIFHTTDGGQTFQHVAPAAFSNGGFPDALYFFDAQHGIVLGDPVGGEYEAYTTADGGATWQAVPAAALPDPAPGEFGLQMTYGVAGDVILFGTNGGRVLRTADRGQTWESIYLPAQPGNTNNVGGISFSDAQNGLLVINYNPDAQSGGQPKPYRTTDGGLTWAVIDNSNGDQFDEYSLLVHVPGTAGTFLAGNWDGYAYTKDYGVTWKYFESGKFRAPCVDCLDAFTCYGSIWHDSKNTGSRVGRWVGYQLANTNPPGPAISMKATPNPATGPVTVTFSSALPADGLLYILDNSNSFLLIQQKLTSGQTSATFNVGSLSPGMYWLKVIVGNKVMMEKFFKN